MVALDVCEVPRGLGSGRKRSWSSAAVIFSWLGMVMLNFSLCLDFVPLVAERAMSARRTQRGERKSQRMTEASSCVVWDQG